MFFKYFFPLFAFYKVSQLRKYLAKKLPGEVEAADDIEVLCNGESLGPELDLYFIKCTRWAQGDTHLLLNYRKRASATWT